MAASQKTRSKATPKSDANRFFDALLNLSAEDSTDRPRTSKPRIVYIRDFNLIADSAPIWYPDLLQSVRDRRFSGKSAQTPVTIVFGSTPLIQPPPPRSGGFAPPQGLPQFNSPRSSPPHPPPVTGNNIKPSAKVDYTESDAADKAREKRLQLRLRKWERDDGSLQTEPPSIPVASPEQRSRPESIFVQVLGFGGLSPVFNPSSSTPTSTPWFKTAVIVPAVRSPDKERVTRVKRRQQINELCLRMAIGSIGGRVDPLPLWELSLDHFSATGLGKLEAGAEKASESPPDTQPSETPSTTVDVPDKTADLAFEKALADWGTRIEDWTVIRKIADRALGSVLTKSNTFSIGASATDPPLGLVPWEDVIEAWVSFKTAKDSRKAWIKEAVALMKGHTAVDGDVDEDGENGEEGKEEDDLVERIRGDPDLDPHQQRLLGCIVDAGESSQLTRWLWFERVQMPCLPPLPRFTSLRTPLTPSGPWCHFLFFTLMPSNMAF